MNDRSLSQNRHRYRTLGDRRRLGFELERLWSRVDRHRGWSGRPEAARRAFASALDLPLGSPGDPVERLEADVRAVTARLVLLAKVLRALDLGEELPDPT